MIYDFTPVRVGNFGKKLSDGSIGLLVNLPLGLGDTLDTTWGHKLWITNRCHVKRVHSLLYDLMPKVVANSVHLLREI